MEFRKEQNMRCDKSPVARIPPIHFVFCHPAASLLAFIDGASAILWLTAHVGSSWIGWRAIWIHQSASLWHHIHSRIVLLSCLLIVCLPNLLILLIWGTILLTIIVNKSGHSWIRFAFEERNPDRAVLLFNIGRFHFVWGMGHGEYAGAKDMSDCKKWFYDTFDYTCICMLNKYISRAC